MWYRQAKKFNIFGLPISGDKKFKYFAEEDLDEQSVEETPLEQPDLEDESTEDLEEIVNPVEIEVEDQTPENEFSPEDLEENIEKIDSDPTVLLALPPLHDNCRCEVKTLPILSVPGVRDGRRVWRRSEDCCEKCEASANEFNDAEVQRLMLKGIDINAIPS
jgi:hypothetical protein